jgi:hypothetical protein
MNTFTFYLWSTFNTPYNVSRSFFLYLPIVLCCRFNCTSMGVSAILNQSSQLSLGMYRLPSNPYRIFLWNDRFPDPLTCNFLPTRQRLSLVQNLALFIATITRLFCTHYKWVTGLIATAYRLPCKATCILQGYNGPTVAARMRERKSSRLVFARYTFRISAGLPFIFTKY